MNAQRNDIERESEPHRMQRLYSLIAGEYAERYGNDQSDFPIIDRFIAALPQPATVLDLGCGPGTFTGHLAQQGCRVIGVDLSATMLSIAARRSPHVHFAQMDMRRIAFVNHVFDGAIAAYSLIHIPDAGAVHVLQEARRVLRPGGVLLVVAQLGATDHLEDDPLAPGERVFVNFFDSDRLATHVVDAGFTIEHLATQPTNDPTSMSQGVVWLLARA